MIRLVADVGAQWVWSLSDDLLHRTIGRIDAERMILIDWVCFLNAVHFATIRLWNTLFGGEGLFIATLTGPGPTWLQSLPFSRLAGSIVSAAGGRGKHSEEGSVLGGLGGMLMGSEE